MYLGIKSSSKRKFYTFVYTVLYTGLAIYHILYSAFF